MKWTILLFTLGTVLVLGACKKKVAPPPPPPPPPPAAPTASLSANPNTIEKGASTTLTWETTNATEVTIDNGVGTVQASGSKQVTPTESTSFHLSAKGPGGTQEATARVTVTAPPPPPPAPSPTEEELFAQNVKDLFFDYDKYDVRPDQQAAIQSDAQFLGQHSNINFTIEGHCDERGSTEYNLALGDNRANAVKNALVQAGVSTSRIKTISYGKEKPFCTESNEQCWQQNRRGHFVYQK